MKKAKNKIVDYSWNFEKADTKYYTHGIYKYPAMMVAPIVTYLRHYLSKKPSQALSPNRSNG